MNYTKITANSGLISLGNTGARLSDSRTKYLEILSSLKEFRLYNFNWAKSDQEQFAELLGKNNVFEIRTDTAVGSAKDTRCKTSFLDSFGFTTEAKIISDSGNELLRLREESENIINEFDLSLDSFVHLKQFLKYQHKNFELLPILSLIYCCLEFENDLPLDFFTFIWSKSSTKDELKQKIKEFKASGDIQQLVYLDCLNSDATEIIKKNCEEFFKAYTLEDKTEFTTLMYANLQGGKGDSYKDKTISLFFDLYQYWQNKNDWNKTRKKTFIKEFLKTRHKDVRLSKGLSYYRKSLFNDDKLSNDSDWVSIIEFFEESPLIQSDSETNFIIHFQVLYSYFGHINNCLEYNDLNIRHLKLLDIFIFEFDSIKLDLLFQYLFKPIKNKLLGVPILEKEEYRNNLETNHKTLGDIYDFLRIEPTELIETIAIDFPEIENIGIKNFAYKKKEERLTKLVEKVFTKENIATLFEAMYPRNDAQVRKLIKEWYSDYDATIPALFEYLLGISFYWISDKEINITEVLDSGLDANLLPKTHAGGGKADIVVKSLARHYLIEATLSEKDGQRKMEAEPVPRHLARHILDGNKNSLALFVAGELDPNNLVILRAYKFLKWYGKEMDVESMDILPLSIKNMIYLLKENLGFEEFEDKINTLLESETTDGKVWYEQEINREFNYAV
jgi:hypothetical protein